MTGYESYLRNMYVSEKEPRMVISSPKILDGGLQRVSVFAAYDEVWVMLLICTYQETRADAA